MLFEAGIAATNLNWHHIQEQVSSFHRNRVVRSQRPRLEQPVLKVSALPETSRLNSTRCWRQQASSRHTFSWDTPSADWSCADTQLSYPEDVAGVVLVDPDALRGVATAQSRQAVDDRSRQAAFRLCDSDCPFRSGPARRDLSVVPFGKAVRTFGRRGRKRRPPCSEARNRRSRKDAQGGLARRCRTLVAAGLLRRNAAPCGGGPGHSFRDARDRSHSRHPGRRTHSGKVDPAVRQVSGQNRKQCAAGDCDRKRTLDPSR